jgi:hypothetical protein
MKSELEAVIEEQFKKELIDQEIRMFQLIGNPVSQEDLDWLCDRRGFSLEDKKLLVDVLKNKGLGSELHA